jgi:23S rRNA (cytosine1962-C5)-methyltransferase
MTKITLNKNEDRRIKSGHPWVFSNEIREVSGERSAGIAAELYDASGVYRCRSLQSAFADRLPACCRAEGRLTLWSFSSGGSRCFGLAEGRISDLTTFRAVYGESDFLPGLVVDRMAIPVAPAAVKRHGLLP